jgi:hypothetical protein
MPGRAVLTLLLYMEEIDNELTVVKDKFFLVIDNKGNRKLAHVNVKTLKMGKRELNVEFFEGKQLNTFWAIDPVEGGSDINEEKVFIYKKEMYTQISYTDFFGESMSILELILVEEEHLEYDNEKIIKNSNKEIYATGSQNLTEMDIIDLKKQGMKGDELIKVIMDNNTSMDKRTILSQEKIMKKKEKRHKYKIWISPVDLYNLVENFFLEDEKKIKYSPFNNSHLRTDTVSTMLTYTNFINDAKTLLLEDTEGFITGIYATRSSKNSNLVSLFQDRPRNKNILYFNLENKQKRNITYLDLNLLKSFNFISKYYICHFDK